MKKMKLAPKEKEAHKDVLKGLMKDMEDMMAAGMKGRSEKVTVMAKDKKGLSQGLDKAKELLGKSDSHEDDCCCGNCPGDSSAAASERQEDNDSTSSQMIDEQKQDDQHEEMNSLHSDSSYKDQEEGSEESEAEEGDEDADSLRKRIKELEDKLSRK